MYWRPPAAAELAQFGLTEADVDRPSVELWPEAWDAWCAFYDCQTQWRMGPIGPTGLDYSAVRHALEQSKADMSAAMDAIRVMESAALEILLKSDKQ